MTIKNGGDGSVSAEKTYTVTAPSGKSYVLRQLPIHFLLFRAELPTHYTEQVAKAQSDGTFLERADELFATLTPKQQTDLVIFAREAVKHAMVNPRLLPIGVDAADETEMSPFDMPEVDFNFLAGVACRPKGGEAETLNNFRDKSDKRLASRARVSKLRATS